MTGHLLEITPSCAVLRPWRTPQGPFSPLTLTLGSWHPPVDAGGQVNFTAMHVVCSLTGEVPAELLRGTVVVTGLQDGRARPMGLHEGVRILLLAGEAGLPMRVTHHDDPLREGSILG